jgi:hypothetical protein
MNATKTLVWVYCDPRTMHTYIRHRGGARDTWKLADYNGYLKSIDIDFRPTKPHIIIDNSASTAHLQAQAKRLLRSVLDGDFR